MVLVALKVSPVGSKPWAAVVVRISKSKKHDLGAVAPFSTTKSSLLGRAGGSTFLQKVVELFGASWIVFAEKLSPCIACTYCFSGALRVLVSLLVRLYVCLRRETWLPSVLL